MEVFIGVFSDSHGDLKAFDAAYELLTAKGARRFFFAGGDYADLDQWFLMRKEKVRNNRDYTDEHFLEDVSTWLSLGEQMERPPAFYGHAEAQLAEEGELVKVKDRFIRTCEKDSAQGREAPGLRKAVDMIGDTLCCLVHDKNDLDKDDLMNAPVIIHGKEPEPKVVQIGIRYFITPGRLTGGREPTCALIERVEKNLRVTAFALDGRVALEEQMLMLDRKNKLSVK